MKKVVDLPLLMVLVAADTTTSSREVALVRIAQVGCTECSSPNWYCVPLVIVSVAHIRIAWRVSLGLPLSTAGLGRTAVLVVFEAIILALA